MNIPKKSTKIGTTQQLESFVTTKNNLLTTNYNENYNLKASIIIYCLTLFYMSFVCHSYITHVYSFVTRMSSICHSHVLACHSYVTGMYSYLIRMSLVCTRMLSICHLYVLVCYPYVTFMYSYVIHMSLVCTRMSSVCHWYVICMLLVCGFTMDRLLILLRYT